MDIAKITIGVVIAVLVVVAGTWAQVQFAKMTISMQEGFADLKAAMGRERAATKDHEERLDKAEKGVVEAKKEAKAKPARIVVVVPTAIVVTAIATPTPEVFVTPTPKRGGLLRW